MSYQRLIIRITHNSLSFSTLVGGQVEYERYPLKNSISIAANKIKGIRAACCSDTYTAKYTRLHNDANVLCFGGRVVGDGLACEIVDAYLSVEFEGGRHQRRVDKIMALEAEDR